MKATLKFLFSLGFFFLWTAFSSLAKHGGKEVTFSVSGNCGMCEKKIEAAAISLKGVKSADWNQNTKKITVVYNEKLTNLEAIKTSIAAAGYDTEGRTASKEAYDRLPGCCQYAR